jgi:small subunit ribosomal protein S19e
LTAKLSGSNIVRCGLIKTEKNQNKMSVYEIPAAEYNQKLAAALKAKEEFKMPDWALFVKTGVSRIRPPADNEYWYPRAASILRQIYLNGIVGVNRLRTKYGSKKIRGAKPEMFMKASGKIIRTILQQAEKAGFLEQVKEGRRFGRRLTKSGKNFLEAIK